MAKDTLGKTGGAKIKRVGHTAGNHYGTDPSAKKSPADTSRDIILGK